MTRDWVLAIAVLVVPVAVEAQADAGTHTAAASKPKATTATTKPATATAKSTTLATTKPATPAPTAAAKPTTSATTKPAKPAASAQTATAKQATTKAASAKAATTTKIAAKAPAKTVADPPPPPAAPPPPPAASVQPVPVADVRAKVAVPSTAHLRIDVPAGLQHWLDEDDRMRPWLDKAVGATDSCYAELRAKDPQAAGTVDFAVTMHKDARPTASVISLPAPLKSLVLCVTSRLWSIKMPLFTGDEGARYSVKAHFAP